MSDVGESDVPENVKLEKTVVILARRDPVEAMRVAAGITIFDHKVTLVFAHGALQVTPEIESNAELLELSEVDVHTLCDDPEVPRIEPGDFLSLIKESDFVINV